MNPEVRKFLGLPDYCECHTPRIEHNCTGWCRRCGKPIAPEFKLNEEPNMTTEPEKKTLREIAKELSKSIQCNCDLDRWEPEQSTGHSWVCRIHKEAVAHNLHTPKPSPVEQAPHCICANYAPEHCPVHGKQPPAKATQDAGDDPYDAFQEWAEVEAEIFTQGTDGRIGLDDGFMEELRKRFVPKNEAIQIISVARDGLQSAQLEIETLRHKIKTLQQNYNLLPPPPDEKEGR